VYLADEQVLVVAGIGDQGCALGVAREIVDLIVGARLVGVDQQPPVFAVHVVEPRVAATFPAESFGSTVLVSSVRRATHTAASRSTSDRRNRTHSATSFRPLRRSLSRWTVSIQLM
jgi:hypothetical protein